MPPSDNAVSAAVEPLLIDLEAAAELLSVSVRTCKRIATDHHEMTVKIGRRRLFRRELLAEWVARGCPAATVRLRK